MNRHIATVIIAPMTTKGRAYPTRVSCQFQGREGQIVLDQLRTVDNVRLVKHLGHLTADEQQAVLSALAELFAE
jgi:mRNA interferase MazF